MLLNSYLGLIRKICLDFKMYLNLFELMEGQSTFCFKTIKPHADISLHIFDLSNHCCYF